VRINDSSDISGVALEQYGTIIARITATMEKRTADWIPLNSNDQRNQECVVYLDDGRGCGRIAGLTMVHLHSPIREKSSQEILRQDFKVFL
jgi:hypothetical protein